MSPRNAGIFAVLIALMFSSLVVDRADAAVTSLRVVFAGIQRPTPTTAIAHFNGFITSNAAGIVRYNWIRSDGTVTPPQPLAFAAPGTRPVHFTWPLNHSYAGWVRLHSVFPNPLGSAPATFAVQITTPRVVAAMLRAEQPVYQGPAPQTVQFRGTITANGPCNVNYTFLRSDGATGPVHNLAFAAAGSQPVSTTWTLGRNYSGWQAIRVTSPNPLVSARAPFRVVIALPARAAR